MKFEMNFLSFYLWYLYSLLIKPDNLIQYNAYLNIKEHTQTPFLSHERSQIFCHWPKNVWATLCLKPFKRNFFKNQVHEVVITGQGIVIVLKSKICIKLKCENWNERLYSNGIKERLNRRLVDMKKFYHLLDYWVLFCVSRWNLKQQWAL